MGKEIELTTYVHPKGICPVRGACKVETPGKEGATTAENSVRVLFDLKGFVNSVYTHVKRIISVAYSSLFHGGTTFDIEVLKECYSWVSKYLVGGSKSIFYSNYNYRNRIWESTVNFITNISEIMNRIPSDYNRVGAEIYRYEVDKLEELYKKAKKEAKETRLIAFVTDPAHNPVEEDEYEDLTGSIMSALPRLGVEVFKINLFPKVEDTENKRNVTAYVTSKTYFNDLDCSVEMIYTTEEANGLDYEKIPSLEVRLQFPPESGKCGEMCQYWFSVEPKPFYRLHFQVIGGSVTAHKILILGDRKAKYTWRRTFKAAPIPGVTTSSLIIQNYFGDVLYYVVDTAEEEE